MHVCVYVCMSAIHGVYLVIQDEIRRELRSVEVSPEIQLRLQSVRIAIERCGVDGSSCATVIYLAPPIFLSSNSGVVVLSVPKGYPLTFVSVAIDARSQVSLCFHGVAASFWALQSFLLSWFVPPPTICRTF